MKNIKKFAIAISTFMLLSVLELPLDMILYPSIKDPAYWEKSHQVTQFRGAYDSVLIISLLCYIIYFFIKEL